MALNLKDSLTLALVFVCATVHVLCDGEVYDTDPSGNDTRSGDLDAVDELDAMVQSQIARADDQSTASEDLEGERTAFTGSGDPTTTPTPDALQSKNPEPDYEYSQPNASLDGVANATERTVPDGGEVTDAAPLSTEDNNVYRPEGEDRPTLEEGEGTPVSGNVCLLRPLPA